MPNNRDYRKVLLDRAAEAEANAEAFFPAPKTFVDIHNDENLRAWREKHLMLSRRADFRPGTAQGLRRKSVLSLVRRQLYELRLLVRELPFSVFRAPDKG